jgi:hypothetical protein
MALGLINEWKMNHTQTLRRLRLYCPTLRRMLAL